MKPRTPAQLTLQSFDAPLPPGVCLPLKARRSRTPENAVTGHDRLIRRVEVQQVTGLSRTSLYRLIAAQDFPTQVHLSTNSVAWLRSEVDAWIADRVAASRRPAAKPSTKARS
jgi:prophage regulatory protein